MLQNVQRKHVFAKMCVREKVYACVCLLSINCEIYVGARSVNNKNNLYVRGNESLDVILITAANRRERNKKKTKLQF